MKYPWMVVVLAGILVTIPIHAGWTENHPRHGNVNPTPEQLAELHSVMDEENKELQPLMAREKELLKIRNALVQAKIKSIPGKKTKAKARAVLNDPEVQAANTDITAVRKTMIERRKFYEDRKKAIFSPH